MAGVSFVIAKTKTIESIKGYKSNSYYLDLYSQYKYLEENNQTRFTPPVQTIYALQKAIDELKIETIQSRYDRYKSLWKTINNNMSSLSFKTFLKEEYQSKIITLYALPKNIEFEELHDYLYKYGITIYPSKFSDQSFRIANIGNLTQEDIAFFIKKIKQFIDEDK